MSSVATRCSFCKAVSLSFALLVLQVRTFQRLTLLFQTFQHDAITREAAKKHGVRGIHTVSAMVGLKTCWECKTLHRSCKTRAMYEKLAVWKSNPGVLSSLLRRQPSFTHKPVRHGAGASRTSRYWFRPAIDAEEERLKAEKRAKREKERKKKEKEKESKSGKKRKKSGKRKAKEEEEKKRDGDDEEVEEEAIDDVLEVDDPNPKIYEVVDLCSDDEKEEEEEEDQKRHGKKVKKEVGSRTKVKIKREAKKKKCENEKETKQKNKEKKKKAPVRRVKKEGAAKTPPAAKAKVKRERKRKRKAAAAVGSGAGQRATPDQKRRRVRRKMKVE